MVALDLFFSLAHGALYGVIWYEISVSIPQAVVIGVLFTMTYINNYRIRHLTAKLN